MQLEVFIITGIKSWFGSLLLFLLIVIVHKIDRLHL